MIVQEEGHHAYIPGMVIGTGIDVVSVARMARLRERHGGRGLTRLFTEAELGYCLELVSSDPSLAARFAAKEAFFKALGTGKTLGGLWTDVEVVRLRTGAPALRLHGRAAEHARERRLRRLHVSLSHTEDVAVAHVVLES